MSTSICLNMKYSQHLPLGVLSSNDERSEPPTSTPSLPMPHPSPPLPELPSSSFSHWMYTGVIWSQHPAPFPASVRSPDYTLHSAYTTVSVQNNIASRKNQFPTFLRIFYWLVICIVICLDLPDEQNIDLDFLFRWQHCRVIVGISWLYVLCWNVFEHCRVILIHNIVGGNYCCHLY